MNYIGSKFKLSSWLKQEICKVVGVDLSDKTICDIFAGTGCIGRAFKPFVKKVISNDIEPYSYILNKNYIGNYAPIQNALNLISELNELTPIENGFIYTHYCNIEKSGRQYFSNENGKKIDAIRVKIQNLKDSLQIDDKAYCFLLASLIESADKVANTASVYGAFLKHIKKSATAMMTLRAAKFELSHNIHDVYCKDANELIKSIDGDILYLDPPYNQRQYGANYHILNTIALYDKFIPKGKTGLRDYTRSKYCQKSLVKSEFENLVKNAKFKYIFLSYNNEGLMSESDIRGILQRYGKYDLVKKEYQRFKADKTQNRNHKALNTTEFLHILEK
ncbi:DNA adenine methylase [Campylobacter sp. faydin G-105]|uniref:DNA adenine methylase n=1 Tax=Campylobacter anatolicus TaxID=2829105 RepID=UPI001B98CC19|nr:DNA adenine methylase [Campylobacter anatolicus]MBR8461357.1 DNA adenine methylase [Campylobacter anatolicus]